MWNWIERGRVILQASITTENGKADQENLEMRCCKFKGPEKAAEDPCFFFFFSTHTAQLNGNKVIFCLFFCRGIMSLCLTIWTQKIITGKRAPPHLSFGRGWGAERSHSNTEQLEKESTINKLLFLWGKKLL